MPSVGGTAPYTRTSPIFLNVGQMGIGYPLSDFPSFGRGLDGPLSITSGVYNLCQRRVGVTTYGTAYTYGGATAGTTVVSVVSSTQALSTSTVGQTVTACALSQANVTSYVPAVSGLTCTSTVSSAVYTGLSSTSGLVVGQLVYCAAPTGGLAFITAINSTSSVTLSNTATSSATGLAFTPLQALVVSQAPAVYASDAPHNFVLGSSRTVDAPMLSLQAVDATGKQLSVARNITSGPCGEVSDFMGGDAVLIINLQGDATSSANVGNFEVAAVAQVAQTGPSAGTITLNNALQNTYGPSNNQSLGNQKVAVLRLPEYTDVTIGNGCYLLCPAFAGTVGGVLTLCAQTLTSTGTGVVSVNGLGYRAGVVSGSAGESNQGNYNVAQSTAPGSGGGGGANAASAGTAGTNATPYVGSPIASSGFYATGGGGGGGGGAGGAAGGGGYGAPGGAGSLGAGGGGGASASNANNAGFAGAAGTYNAGGAAGSNPTTPNNNTVGGAGGAGGPTAGAPGTSVGQAQLSQMFFGGAGGNAGFGLIGGAGGNGGDCAVPNASPLNQYASQSGGGGAGGGSGGGYWPASSVPSAASLASRGAPGTATGNSPKASSAPTAIATSGSASSPSGLGGNGAGVIVMFVRSLSANVTANGQDGAVGSSGGAGGFTSSYLTTSGYNPSAYQGGAGGPGSGGGGGGGGAGGTINLVTVSLASASSFTANGGASGGAGAAGVAGTGYAPSPTSTVPGTNTSGAGIAGKPGGAGAVGRVRIAYLTRDTTNAASSADGAGAAAFTTPPGYKQSL